MITMRASHLPFGRRLSLHGACRASPRRRVSRRIQAGASVTMDSFMEGEVLIRVRACGVCRTDLHVVEGELPVRKAHVIPGHQIVGTVGATAPGTRVGVPWLHRTCGICEFCRSAPRSVWIRSGRPASGFARRFCAPDFPASRRSQNGSERQSSKLLWSASICPAEPVNTLGGKPPRRTICA